MQFCVPGDKNRSHWNYHIYILYSTFNPYIIYIERITLCEEHVIAFLAVETVLARIIASVYNNLFLLE